MRYCQPVSLSITHDWAHTKAMVLKMLALESKAHAVEEYGLSDHYSIGALGTISKHHLSKSWYRLSSPVVSKTIPWLAELLDTLKELKPDDGCISVMHGHGGEHVDFPNMQSALNFIFDNTDPEAFTWVKHNDQVETYPSTVNTAWILDTQKSHGISNNGERWSLSIHFNTDYNIVKEWFDNNPNLEFGKK